MKYNVMNGKEVLGSFDKKEAAEFFATTYGQAIGADLQVVDATKKAEVEKAPTMDTIQFANDNGMEALEEELQAMSLDELKDIIKANGLDPNRQYGRVKKADRLIEIILVVTRQRVDKGIGFLAC